jgi:predicted enzyme related to lactoylglutathione lyase
MGGITHLEIPATDTGRAKTFWNDFQGWQFQAMEGPVEYHMTQIAEGQGGAIYPAEGDDRGMRPYFDVDDIQAGAARVRELGGKADDPGPVPGMGWYATCTDTEGNKFGLWQNDPSAAPPSE